MNQPADFGFNDEAKALKQTARQFFQKRLPTHQLHQLVANEHDPARQPTVKWDKNLWQEMASLGWTTLAVPESAGGMDVPLTAVAGLMEEAGRAALPSPLFSLLQASYLLRACNTDAATDALKLILQGTICCVANDTSVSATQQDGRIVLNGTCSYVQDAAKADYVLVIADNVYLVALDATGLTLKADHIVDLTRDQAHLVLHNVIASEILSDTGKMALARAMPAWLTLLAADMAGAAEWQLQTTTEYARTRVQFDHPIGYFQAVKHPLVDWMLLIDQTRALVYNAACAVDHEPDMALYYACMAKAAASDMAAFAARKSVQLHGGIGFTWECFVHIYQKRQKHSQILLGDSMQQRQRLADILLNIHATPRSNTCE